MFYPTLWGGGYKIRVSEKLFVEPNLQNMNSKTKMRVNPMAISVNQGKAKSQFFRILKS